MKLNVQSSVIKSDVKFIYQVIGKTEEHYSQQKCVWVFVCVSLFVSWVAYEGAQFRDNMYVLEEGEYPNTVAMGFLSSDSIIRSIHTTGHVSTVYVCKSKRILKNIFVDFGYGQEYQ